MITQPEALRLANVLDSDPSDITGHKAASELRRLHADNEMQFQSLKAARILMESSYQLTKKDESLMRQALEALEEGDTVFYPETETVIADLRERLGEQK